MKYSSLTNSHTPKRRKGRIEASLKRKGERKGEEGKYQKPVQTTWETDMAHE